MLKKNFWSTVIVFCGLLSAVQAQTARIQEMYLYEGTIPNSRPGPDREERKANTEVDSLAFKVSVPTLTAYFPGKNTQGGKAVIICPGGGYGVLLTKREGSDPARALNRLGYTAFVLKYRLPDKTTMQDPAIGPIQDAQQAIAVVRRHAAAWGIAPDKIGIMGFSAGGHLASTAGTHYHTMYSTLTKGENVRPDFMILINPVISFLPAFGHQGSAKNLLGENASPERVSQFSNELHIRPDAPPAFLVHSGNDVVVPVENSLAVYEALRKHKIPAAMHIYDKGEHGFLTAPSLEEWFGRLTYWLGNL